MSDDDCRSEEDVTALKELVQSRGWQLLLDYAKTAWGPQGYSQQIQHALRNVPHGPDRVYELARITEQVDATCTAMNVFMSWPGEQVNRLSVKKGPTMPFSALRRGTR